MSQEEHAPFGFIPLIEAVRKYGVAQRVIERMIQQGRVQTWRRRGDALHVKDADLKALADANELRDIRAAAAEGSSSRGEDGA